MCNIDAVLFDLDGVLVDACEWHFESRNKALKDSGYDIINRESHISTYNGLPTKVKLKMLGLSNNMIEYINLQKQKYTLEIITNTAKTMPEKVELHRYLQSKNIKIGCVTNSIKETTEHMLRSTGQFEYIDIIVTNEDVNNNKPTSQVLNILKGNFGDYSGQYELTSVAESVTQSERYSDWYDSDDNCNTQSSKDYSMIDHILVTQGIINKISNALMVFALNKLFLISFISDSKELHSQILSFDLTIDP